MNKNVLRAITAINTTPWHYYVNESLPRTSPRNTSFSGTVRNVPGTYATITAAITASASGDIIQLADGTYDMTNEPNGYLLWNASTKNLLIRGNASNPAAVLITQSGVSSFCVRLYKPGELRFENLTITSTKNQATIYQDWDARSINLVFKNCVLGNTNNGSSARIYGLQDTSNSALASHIEFSDCTFNKSDVVSFITDFNKAGSNVQLLFNNNTYNCPSCAPLYIRDGNQCKIAVYDCNMPSLLDTYGIGVGQDTAVPTQTFGLVDLRGNTIAYDAAHGGHGILLGRGTTNIYVINNNISIPAGTSAAWIGIVAKTISTNLENAIIAGNISNGVRPLLIKGGSYIKMKYNTCVSNDSNNIFYGLEMTNTNEGDGLLVSENCEARYNNLFGKSAGIGCGTAVYDPLSKTSIQNWQVNNNKYYSVNGDFAYDGVFHTFPNKNNFWTGAPTNDNSSKMVKSNAYNISAVKKDI